MNTSPQRNTTTARSTLNVRRTEKVSEVIAREIVKDSRGFPPGTMLPSETKLLERYQVGRASLREALRLLEVQGLIVIRPGPGGGPMIAEVDSVHFSRMSSLYFQLAGATYRDAIEARVILEPVVAGMIAKEQDVEHIERLKAYLGRTSAGSDGSDLPNEEERSFEFHAMLMGMSGNPVINLLVRSLQDLQIDRWAATRPKGHYTADADEVHCMIAQAIVDARPADAERLMHEHMHEFIQFELEHDPRHLEQTIAWH